MDELIDQLRCIVAALRAQNAFNERWMALQAQWHEEVERLNEQRYQEHSARENNITMAFIDSMTRNETSDESPQYIQPVSEVGNQEDRAES